MVTRYLWYTRTRTLGRIRVTLRTYRHYNLFVEYE